MDGRVVARRRRRLALFHLETRTEIRWSSHYVVPMNRAWLAGVFLLIAGATALGCGGTNSSTGGQATSTTVSGQEAGTALGWLSSIAEPWNHKLNGDQQAIDTASAASSGGAPANSYFAGLGTVCSKMVDDAGRAQNIARAPSAALDQAWRTMVVQTKKYASRLRDPDSYPFERRADHLEQQPEEHEHRQRRVQRPGGGGSPADTGDAPVDRQAGRRPTVIDRS